MGSGHTLGEQNAATLGDLGTSALTRGEGFFDDFTILTRGRKTTTASAVTATVTHGCGATPTFVLASCNTKTITYTSNSTSITFVKSATGAAIIDWVAGVTA